MVPRPSISIRVIKELRNRIEMLGLGTIFETKKRFVKTTAVGIILQDMKNLINDYSVSQLSDLLTQAGGSPIQTNFLHP